MAVAYETQVDIPLFSGLDTSGDGYNKAMRLAREMENVNVTGGRFAPMREGRKILQALEKPIGTLAVLNRRYGFTDDERNLLVAVSDGKLWTKLLDGDDAWIVRYTGLSTDNCDFVSYEINEEGNDPIDVLLLSNAIDGMICLYGNDLHVVTVQTPYKFGVIARFNERIWGTAIDEKPDSLVYSKPYNPFDWDADEDIPEDGGGEIMQPSWDGDRFLALCQYGSQLLAFKKNSIWRVLGTDPGEFIIREQYGHGAVQENTICTYNDVVWLLGYGGIMRYDGSLTLPFKPEETSGILRERFSEGAWDKATAVIRDRTYCLAVALDGSETNNAVLEYNCAEGSFSLRTGISVKAFTRAENRVFYTSDTEPGCIYEMVEDGHALPVKWVSAYQDLGLKSSVKSGFMVYFVAEAETPFDLVLGIRTEKKLKEKRIQVKPGKPNRIQLNVSGRYFRLELSSTTLVPYEIKGGFRIYMELDPD